MPEVTFVPGPDSHRAYRDALGCFGTGITVITTQTVDGPLAITVNSFTSVSLDPPLLLWCPAQSSLRHDTFVNAERFAIHVLAEGQFEMAQHFAKNGEAFDTVNWHLSAEKTPYLPGAIARFECKKFADYPGGDHTIVLGEVTSVTTTPGKGLIFKRGQYGGFLEQP